MDAPRTLLRIAAAVLVAGAGLLAVAIGGGWIGESTVLPGVADGTGGTAVVVLGILLILLVVVLGGAWAYRRSAGPVPEDRDADGNEWEEESAGFGGYENFEAFVAAGGIDEYRREEAREDERRGGPGGDAGVQGRFEDPATDTLDPERGGRKAGAGSDPVPAAESGESEAGPADDDEDAFPDVDRSVINNGHKDGSDDGDD